MGGVGVGGAMTLGDFARGYFAFKFQGPEGLQHGL